MNVGRRLAPDIGATQSYGGDRSAMVRDLE
jgi:hypothetical protein